MIGLFFGGAWFKTNFGNDFGNIELDATIEESHEWTAEATSNPVEDGAPVTDHVIENSDKLTLKGVVTEAPITTSASIPQLSRSKDVFDLLQKLIKLREPITVYTHLRIYTDMILTNVNIPRSASDGEAIEFTANFVNIRKVSTEIVDIPKGINPKKSAKSTKSIGKKTEPKKDGGVKQSGEAKPVSAVLKSRASGTADSLIKLISGG